MKSFNKYNNTKLISLEGLEENVIEKFNNINGQQINECCCCCCDPCNNDKCCNSQFIYFYSENEIICKLKSDVKVQDLYNLHSQFGYKFRFKSENPTDVCEPLYFSELQGQPINTNLLGELSANMQNAQYNPKVNDFVKKLCDTYKFTYPVVLSKVDNTVQLFFIKETGTNGKENSIKNSLLEVYELLSELDKNKLIGHSQILDISIDNTDDVYTFLVTCFIKI